MNMDMSIDISSDIINYNEETFTRTDYNGISVLVDSNGYYSASKICKDNKKRFTNWLRNDRTQALLEAYSRNLGISIRYPDARFSASGVSTSFNDSDAPSSNLDKTGESMDARFSVSNLFLMYKRSVTGGDVQISNDLQGWWIHPKLVHHLAEWANLDYAWKVSEIMDLINERIHLLNTSLQEEIDTLKQENQTLKDRVDLLDQKVSDAYDVNLVLHENASNLMHDVNDLKPRAVPAGTNDKLLRIMIESKTGLCKITANSFWTDDRFKDDGYTVIKHYQFPASMNVRQILKDCSYIKRLYFEYKHMDEICEIIKNNKPLKEW